MYSYQLASKLAASQGAGGGYPPPMGAPQGSQPPYPTGQSKPGQGQYVGLPKPRNVE
jgi:hypothetical protein